MSTGNIMWLVLVYVLLQRAARIDFMTIFTIVASGIVVFVPLYKKYVEKGRKDNQ